jgi:hypothetical protein
MTHCSAAIAEDLRRSCIYGYAHRTVAHTFGVRGIVNVVFNLNGGDTEKHYTGEFRARAVLLGRPARLVGMAGTVAACYDEDPGVLVREIGERLSYGLFDAPALGAPPVAPSEHRDIAQCLTIIRERWHRILRNARNHASFVARQGTSRLAP